MLGLYREEFVNDWDAYVEEADADLLNGTLWACAACGLVPTSHSLNLYELASLHPQRLCLRPVSLLHGSLLLLPLVVSLSLHGRHGQLKLLAVHLEELAAALRCLHRLLQVHLLAATFTTCVCVCMWEYNAELRINTLLGLEAGFVGEVWQTWPACLSPASHGPVLAARPLSLSERRPSPAAEFGFSVLRLF